MNSLITPSRDIAKPTHDLTTIQPNIGTRLDYICVDGSGSMQSKWWPTIDALDALLCDLRNDPVCQNNHLVATAFSAGEYMDMMQRNGPLLTTPLLGEEDPANNVHPLGSVFGGTALYDAIGLSIHNVNTMNPTDASIVFASDGEEMDSKIYDLTQAKRFIKWAQEVKGWQITIIGCDWNSKKLAEQLGLQPAQAIGVAKAHLNDAALALAAKRKTHARTGAPMHWTEDEQKQFGGYLTSGGSK